MKKERKFKVEAVMTGNPPVQSVEMRDENGHVVKPDVPIVFNKSTDKIRKVDHYRIRFELANPGGTNLRFVKHNGDAMWCHALPTCPTSPGEMPGVFWVDEIDPNGAKWIDVINMDMTLQEFGFALNLVDKNIANPTPADYVWLDPIIRNEDRGGGGSGYPLTAFAAIALGIGAGLLAYAGASLLLTG